MGRKTRIREKRKITKPTAFECFFFFFLFVAIILLATLHLIPFFRCFSCTHKCYVYADSTGKDERIYGGCENQTVFAQTITFWKGFPVTDYIPIKLGDPQFEFKGYIEDYNKTFYFKESYDDPYKKTSDKSFIEFLYLFVSTGQFYQRSGPFDLHIVQETCRMKR